MAMDSDVNHAALQTVLNAPDEELKSAQDDQRREEDHRLYDTAVFADDQGKHTEEHENGHTMVSHKFQSLDLGGAEEVQTSEEGEDKGGGGHGGGGDDRKAGSNQGLHPSTPLSMNKVQGSKAIVKRDMVEDTVAARERDISAAFAGLPRVKSHWTHNYLKILLVGEDGLGKTTFVRNLFAAYASDVDFPVADASAPGAFDLFQSHPERLCTELVVKDEDALVWWHYLIQDTPGYGDFDGPHDAETQRNAIVDYVNSSLQKHLDGELDPKRRLALHTIPDVRVDVCLYFLPPHRMRQTDARFVKELRSIGGLPVLPIIAKADTMTAEELAVFRESVCHSMLQKASTGWKFSKEALEGAGAGKESYDIPPFAVVSAATVDRSVGRFWPVRKYPWGTCEPLLSAHSDLPVLRRLLFETGFWELKAQTERRYLAFRKDEWKERHSLVPVRTLVIVSLKSINNIFTRHFFSS
jgi:septin family protein